MPSKWRPHCGGWSITAVSEQVQAPSLTSHSTGKILRLCPPPGHRAPEPHLRLESDLNALSSVIKISNALFQFSDSFLRSESLKRQNVYVLVLKNHTFQLLHFPQYPILNNARLWGCLFWFTNPVVSTAAGPPPTLGCSTAEKQRGGPTSHQNVYLARTKVSPTVPPA